MADGIHCSKNCNCFSLFSTSYTPTECFPFYRVLLFRCADNSKPSFIRVMGLQGGPKNAHFHLVYVKLI